MVVDRVGPESDSASSPQPEAVTAYIGLGGNLGSADALRARLHAAAQALHALPATLVLAVSSLYASAAWEADGPDYLNAVVCLSTGLEPLPLLHHLQAIEQAHQRQRPYRNAPRTLDLDLLLYGEHRIDSEELSVPHPRIAQRAFVLVPLAELAPQLELAGHGPIASLLPAVAQQRLQRLHLPAAWWALSGQR